MRDSLQLRMHFVLVPACARISLRMLCASVSVRACLWNLQRSADVCVYIHTYIHIYIYIHIYMYVCMYVCIYIYIHIHTHIHIHIHTFIHTYIMHACMHAYISSSLGLNLYHNKIHFCCMDTEHSRMSFETTPRIRSRPFQPKAYTGCLRVDSNLQWCIYLGPFKQKKPSFVACLRAHQTLIRSSSSMMHMFRPFQP